MAYSHLRLRKTLALVRIFIGVLFLELGAHKISSLEFARIEFPQFMWDATHGAAVGFYGAFLNAVVWDHPGRYAVLVALTELFIGVGLVLGLAIRPISLVGMLYIANLILATCMAPGPNEGLWRYLDNETKLIALFFLFLLFGIGHAGETWGLGSIYHHHRHWEEAGEPEEQEPASGRKAETYSERYGDESEDDNRQTWELGESSNVRRIKS